MFPKPINSFVAPSTPEDKNRLMEFLQPPSHTPAHIDRAQEPSNKLPSLNEVFIPQDSSVKSQFSIPTVPSKPMTQPTTSRPIILPPPKPQSNESRVERRRYSLPSFMVLPNESRPAPPPPQVSYPLDTIRHVPLTAPVGIQKAIPVTTHPLNTNQTIPTTTTSPFSKQTVSKRLGA